jgi:hypothetical protein
LRQSAWAGSRTSHHMLDSPSLFEKAAAQRQRSFSIKGAVWVPRRRLPLSAFACLLSCGRPANGASSRGADEEPRPPPSVWRIGGARRRAGRDSLSLPHGYHERGAVAGCVRHQQRAVVLDPLLSVAASAVETTLRISPRSAGWSRAQQPRARRAGMGEQLGQHRGRLSRTIATSTSHGAACGQARQWHSASPQEMSCLSAGLELPPKPQRSQRTGAQPP